MAWPLVYAGLGRRDALDLCGLLGRCADARALAVKEWVNTILLALGMIAGFLITIDHWVHRREMGEATLATKVKGLQRQIEEGRSIWERSVEVGHTVQALQAMVIEVKEIFDRALARDERLRERFSDMKEQLARVEEHLKSTDREVISLGKDVESLRKWMVDTHGQAKL